MNTEFRNEGGSVVCIRYYGGKERGACLDFLTQENFNFYHNDEMAVRMPVFGDNGSQYILWDLIYQTTGTHFLPNPRITFGEVS